MYNFDNRNIILKFSGALRAPIEIKIYRNYDCAYWNLKWNNFNNPNLFEILKMQIVQFQLRNWKLKFQNSKFTNFRISNLEIWNMYSWNFKFEISKFGNIFKLESFKFQICKIWKFCLCCFHILFGFCSKFSKQNREFHFFIKFKIIYFGFIKCRNSNFKISSSKFWNFKTQISNFIISNLKMWKLNFWNLYLKFCILEIEIW